MSARDPHRALIAWLEDELGPLIDLASVATPWFSATFSGQRHRFDFVATRDDRAEAFTDALPEVEIPLHKHFVADAEMVSRIDNRLMIEMLTIEEV